MKPSMAFPRMRKISIHHLKPLVVVLHFARNCVLFTGRWAKNGSVSRQSRETTRAQWKRQSPRRNRSGVTLFNPWPPPIRHEILTSLNFTCIDKGTRQGASTQPNARISEVVQTDTARREVREEIIPEPQQSRHRQKRRGREQGTTLAR
jgi:hypothetical protein